MSTELLPDQPQYTDFSTILADERFKNLSGLDMAPTIEWYNANKEFLLGVLNRNLQFANRDAYLPPTEGLENITLGRAELKALRGLFPSAARERSIINTIIGEPPLWFHRDSLEGEQKPTRDSADSLSPTAVIPGHTGFENWPYATMYLNTIPSTATEDPDVATLITAEAAIHEEVDGMTTNLLYGKRNLLLPFGGVATGKDFIVNVFGEIAKEYPPISHYSSHFRTEDGRFVNPDNPQLAICEELAETATLMLLGFNSGSLTNLQSDVLASRKKLREVILDLFNARTISHEETTETLSPEELRHHYLR